jgi:hypothetical protein
MSNLGLKTVIKETRARSRKPLRSMRPENAPRTRSWAVLHHAPTSSTHSSPLQFSPWKSQGFAKEEEGIMSQTHNVVAKYWGKGGILKWAEFLCSRASP